MPFEGLVCTGCGRDKASGGIWGPKNRQDPVTASRVLSMFMIDPIAPLRLSQQRKRLPSPTKLPGSMNVSDRPFYCPEETDDPMVFRLRAVPSTLVGPPGRMFLMGGVGFGAAINAMERACDRPLICATIQFISNVGPDAELSLHVEKRSEGGSITQAHVWAREQGRDIFSITGALGGRSGFTDEQFLTMPDVPPPDSFLETLGDFPELTDLHKEIKKHRVLSYRDGEGGRDAMWFKTVKGYPVSASQLAIFADFFAGGRDDFSGAASLDNMIRIRHIQDTEWVLAVTQFSGVGNGILQGQIALFADDGTLLATGGQSSALPRQQWR